MPENTSDAAVIIPQRNHEELTRACVCSLRTCEGDDVPVIVVDDGSDESIDEHVAEKVRVVSQPRRGLTAAWNAGIDAVRTRFVVLLNNDVVIGEPFVERLLTPLDEGRASIVGVEWRTEPLVPACLTPRLPGRRLVSGWCWAFGRSLWERLGGFDEALRLYFSDTDFQCRAAAQRRPTGRVLTIIAAPSLRHWGHRTARDDPRRMEQWRADRERFLTKWKREAIG